MNDSDSEHPEEWDDRGDLAWNEFDWERYLREQDQAVHRYLGYYELFIDSMDRLDAVARKMGWDTGPESVGSGDLGDESEIDPAEFAPEETVYTLHKNPVFVATKAICLSLRRNWELTAGEPGKIPAELALPYLSRIGRAEDMATQAIYALDFGDFAMAVSLFKRALSAINDSLALLGCPQAERLPAVVAYARDARRQLFDLREVWLRVVCDCRAELERGSEDESEPRS